jgi:multicomponent Na+:H+ antiporter subunit B
MVERRSLRDFASLLFALGLAFMLLVLAAQFDFGAAPMLIGDRILQAAPTEVGAGNIVTAVVLGYRGIDTLGEIAILFAAATAAGLVLGRRREQVRHSDPDAGFILLASADLLFPLLLVVGFYIILHGHLTPGGGFQGGVILAAAFFIPLLARPGQRVDHAGISLIEGIAGAVFILIGLAALYAGKAFMQPLLDKGQLGALVSAGTLPLLYLALGLKVGAELAGLLAHIADVDAPEAEERS